MTLSAFIQTSKPNSVLMTMGRSQCCDDGEFIFQINSQGYLEFSDCSNSTEFCFLNGTSNSTVTSGTIRIILSVCFFEIQSIALIGSRTYVAFVKTGSSGFFYIDGQISGEITSQCVESISYNNSFFTIGADGRNLNEYFEGVIDHISVFAVALLPIQLLDIYQNPNSLTYKPTAAPTILTTISPTVNSPTYPIKTSNPRLGTWTSITISSGDGLWNPKLLTVS
jgi:hypothetical protein